MTGIRDTRGVAAEPEAACASPCGCSEWLGVGRESYDLFHRIVPAAQNKNALPAGKTIFNNDIATTNLTRIGDTFYHNGDLPDP